MVARTSLLVALVLLPTSALADIGDLALGPVISGAYAAEGRVGGIVRLGIGDWVAFDARIAAALDESGVAGVGSLGVVAAWDVLAWVPELRLAGGGRAGEGGFDPRVIAELGVRHYLALELSLLLSAGAEWSPEAWRGVGSVALLFSL